MNKRTWLAIFCVFVLATLLNAFGAINISWWWIILPFGIFLGLTGALIYLLLLLFYKRSK